jgi:hypothetical protein
MSRLRRRLKSEFSVRALEQEFADTLLTALKRCESGEWGLFGCYDKLDIKSYEAETLLRLGEQISAMRKDLGETEPFHPYQRFLEYRSLKSPDTHGEPKLAVRFLAELN